MRILLPFLVFLIFISGLTYAQKGGGQKSTGITGIVSDAKNNPLGGASVSVENVKRSTTTSVTGDFVLQLPAGTYTLRFSFVGYETKRITDVIVTEGNQTNLNITLAAGNASILNEVVVTSSAKKESANSLLRAQKNNASMTDGISAEQMKGTPDVNVAQSLTRVSAVNVQGGKFVTIRGVSDRYNNVLINGSSLPSTEPNRRNFSFDIVPNSLVDNIIVNKTATPDLPGEFTGGMVQVNTKDIPTANFLQVVIGTGVNTASLNENYKSFGRNSKDWIGSVDKDRLWFGEGRPVDAFKYFQDFNNNDTAATRAVSRQIPMRWQYKTSPYTPIQNYQINGGLAKRYNNGSSLGVVAALTYLNEQFYEEGEARGVANFDYAAERYKYFTTIGSLLNVGYKSRKFKLSWKNLYNQRYSSQSDEREGMNYNTNLLQNRFADVVFLGKLFQTRLEGEYIIPASQVKLDGFADYITYNREQPDTRYLTSFFPQYSYEFIALTLDYGGLFASVFDETRSNLGMNASIPFKIKDQKQLFKVGFLHSGRNADYENSGLRIRTSNLSKLPQAAFVPYYTTVNMDAINNGVLFYSPAYANNSSTGDTYQGKQILNAAYMMADLKIFKKLRVIGGLRYENNRMDVTTSRYLYDNGDNKDIDTTSIYKEPNWLPSVNLVYSFNEKSNLRGAFSQTVARPDFVERSFIYYYDFVDQIIVNGSTGLKMTTILNYDLRYEFYPTAGEIFSFSLFYKDFTNPVEKNLETGNPSNFIQYRNLAKATAFGFEVDVRKNLGFLAPGSDFFKYLLINGNFTYLNGNVTDNSNVIQDRPIQGLAPYIVNAGLAYQKPTWGVNLAFNRSGRKIVSAGDLTLVQYELPRSILDLQVNAKMLKQKMELRLSFGDLLNQPFIIYSNCSNDPLLQGQPNNDPKGEAFNSDLDFVNYKVTKGINIMLTASYKF
jgi:hypothetical protein